MFVSDGFIELNFKAVLKTLQAIIDNEEHTARDFCGELHKQLSSYFVFLINPDAVGFLPIYYVASYLSPIHKFVIGPSQIAIVREYLERKPESGKFSLNFLFFICR